MPSERASAEKSNRPVTADDARRIAAEAEADRMFRDAHVTGTPPGPIYGLKHGEYWFVYPQDPGGPLMVGASRVIVIDKNTGAVVAATNVGE